MAKGTPVHATDVLADLESLALRDLEHQTERLRAALARAAPSRADAIEHGELSRARLGASDALDLYVRAHDAGRAARAEAQEEEMEVQVKAWQQDEDRRRFEHDG